MKYTLTLLAIIMMTTVSCRTKYIASKFERVYERACGCTTTECAKDAFEEYQDLTLKYVDKKDFRKNIDYINELSENIKYCLSSNGVSGVEIATFHTRVNYIINR